MSAKTNPAITGEMRKKIIERWKSGKNNQLTVIAAEFNCTTHQIDQCVDYYLKPKSRWK